MKLLSSITLIFCALLFVGCTEDITLGEEPTKITTTFDKRKIPTEPVKTPPIEVDCAKLKACPWGEWVEVHFNLCAENFYHDDLYLWAFQDGEAHYIGNLQGAAGKTRYSFIAGNVSLAGDITLYVSGSSLLVNCDSPYSDCGGAASSCSARYDLTVSRNCRLSTYPNNYYCPTDG